MCGYIALESAAFNLKSLKIKFFLHTNGLEEQPQNSYNIRFNIMLDISVREKSPVCIWLRKVSSGEYKGAPTKDAWALLKEKVEDIIVYIKYILPSIPFNPVY